MAIAFMALPASKQIPARDDIVSTSMLMLSLHAPSSSNLRKTTLFSEWIEAGKRTLKQLKVSIDTVDLYIQCIYGQPLAIEPNLVLTEDMGSEDRQYLTKLFSFESKVQNTLATKIVVKVS